MNKKIAIIICAAAAAVLIAFLLGGLVKGTVGLGLPTVSMARKRATSPAAMVKGAP